MTKAASRDCSPHSKNPRVQQRGRARPPGTRRTWGGAGEAAAWRWPRPRPPSIPAPRCRWRACGSRRVRSQLCSRFLLRSHPRAACCSPPAPAPLAALRLPSQPPVASWGSCEASPSRCAARSRSSHSRSNHSRLNHSRLNRPRCGAHSECSRLNRSRCSAKLGEAGQARCRGRSVCACWTRCSRGGAGSRAVRRAAGALLSSLSSAAPQLPVGAPPPALTRTPPPTPPAGGGCARDGASTARCANFGRRTR
mmetsp:Transcript_20515/g.52073  ORF Transcript_20515/g.52073 Transcript_20515/m.52073 type:complete len:252 (-) Transcript_20515:833-1588(-)